MQPESEKFKTRIGRLELRPHQIDALDYVHARLESGLSRYAQTWREIQALTSQLEHGRPVKGRLTQARTQLRYDQAELGILLAHAMRTGKTAVAIRVLHEFPRWIRAWTARGLIPEELAGDILSRPNLALAPTHRVAHVTWPEEFERWTDRSDPAEAKARCLVLGPEDNWGDVFSTVRTLSEIGAPIKLIVTMYQSIRSTVHVARAIMPSAVLSPVQVANAHLLNHADRLAAGQMPSELEPDRRSRTSLVQAVRWGIVIADESHVLSDPSSATAQAVYGLDCLVRLALSGTPFTSVVHQLWGTLSWLQGSSVWDTEGYWLRRSHIWETHSQFMHLYTDATSRGGRRGINLTHDTAYFYDCHFKVHPPDSPQCRSLHSRLARHTMHRVSFQEATGIDPLTPMIVESEMTPPQAEVYRTFLDGVIEIMQAQEQIDTEDRFISVNDRRAWINLALEIACGLHQIAHYVETKTDSKAFADIFNGRGRTSLARYTHLNWQDRSGKWAGLKDLLDNQIEGKVLVLTHWQATAEEIARNLENYGATCAHAGLGHHRIESNLDTFRRDPDCRVLAATDILQVGVRLEAEAVVVFGHYSWNPGNLLQGASRLCRLDLERPVPVYVLVTPDTVEAYAARVLFTKQTSFGAAIDGNPGQDVNVFALMAGMTAQDFIDALRGKVH